MEKFQLALYRHHESGDQSVHRFDDMQAFCQTQATHLFYILISARVSADWHATSKRHSHLQQQRIVAWLHMFPYFSFYFKLQFTCLKFCHLKNKESLYFKNFTKFPSQLYSDIISSHWYKTTLVLSIITGIICNFPQTPPNITSPKISGSVPWYSWVNQVSTDCRESLGLCRGLCMNDMFKQQQAKKPWESCEQNCANSLQDKAEQIQWTININNFEKT